LSAALSRWSPGEVVTAPMPGDELGDCFGMYADPVDGSFWGIGSYVSNEFVGVPPDERYEWASQVFRFFD